ncbi:MAG: hypothetical protein IJO99_02025 [Ruminococcus sp.]|nr:hypothetical protein [Ruminococcus sp.]
MRSISDALQRYIGRELNINVVEGEEIYGTLRECGDNWILITDEDNTDFIFNTNKIIYVYVEEN